MQGKEIKRRLQGAQETIKITRAMQLMSVAKMNKLQRKYYSSLAFLEEMKNILSLLGDKKSVFTERRSGKKAYVIISSDKGLCGDYNYKLLSFADSILEQNEDVRVFVIGEYGKEYYARRGTKTDGSYASVMQNPVVEDALNISKRLIEEYVNKLVDEVYVIYTEVDKNNGPQTQDPTVCKILPLELEETEDTQNETLVDKKHVDGILEQYIWASIYYALNSSGLAVNFKRMVAMQQATKNGEELAEKLTATYNHLRQETITNELIDAEINKRGKHL